MNAEQIAQQHVNEGQYKMSSHELYANYKIFGDYYYNCYSRKYNKLMKEKQTVADNKILSKLQTIVDLLFSQHETLKVQYLQMCNDWAVADFNRHVKRANAPYPVWDDFVKKTETDRHDYKGQKEYRQACDARHASNNIVEKGLTAYVAREMKLAELHYETCIHKLALRIDKKGLDIAKLVVKTSHVGVNVETVLTDSVQTVKAFTIIASGAVQRPHYRYLVK